MIRLAVLRSACLVLGMGLAASAYAQEQAQPADPGAGPPAGQPADPSADSPAEGAFPDGLWVFGDTCEAAASGTVEDGIVLTRTGTRAPQSRCDFVRVIAGGEKRWAVVELCTGRDSTFARLSSLVILENGAAVLASEAGGELEFDRCPDPEPVQAAPPEEPSREPAEAETGESPDGPAGAEGAPGDTGSGGEGTGN